MTMIAYAFLQYCRLKTARREKKNQRATASTDIARRTPGHRRTGPHGYGTQTQANRSRLFPGTPDRCKAQPLAPMVAALSQGPKTIVCGEVSLWPIPRPLHSITSSDCKRTARTGLMPQRARISSFEEGISDLRFVEINHHYFQRLVD
jgi:hypothetical protein